VLVARREAPMLALAEELANCEVRSRSSAPIWGSTRVSATPRVSSQDRAQGGEGDRLTDGHFFLARRFGSAEQKRFDLGQCTDFALGLELALQPLSWIISASLIPSV
jgi:hypothetical protein